MEHAAAPTSMGMNRTGGQMSPIDVERMTDYARSTGSDVPTGADGERLLEPETLPAAQARGSLMSDADQVGSVPLPGTVKGVVSTAADKLGGKRPEVFIDKLGERLAFERTGVRLYDSMIIKCQALAKGVQGQNMLDTLRRFRFEEAAHMAMVDDAMQQLGADPTAMTPCADTSAVAAMGVIQVLNDPRTTLPQCLSALLTTELTDNAGWELLVALARRAGHHEMAELFTSAFEEENTHLQTVKAWLEESILSEAR